MPLQYTGQQEDAIYLTSFYMGLVVFALTSFTLPLVDLICPVIFKEVVPVFLFSCMATCRCVLVAHLSDF